MKILNIFIIVSILLFNSCSLDEEEKEPSIKVFFNNTLKENDNSIIILDNTIVKNLYNHYLKIVNIGDKPLIISSIIFENTLGNSYIASNEYDSSLNGGESKTYGIGFYTALGGHYVCNITINSNATNSPIFQFPIHAYVPNE